jgi:hypothetical protein
MADTYWNLIVSWVREQVCSVPKELLGFLAGAARLTLGAETTISIVSVAKLNADGTREVDADRQPDRLGWTDEFRTSLEAIRCAFRIRRKRERLRHPRR